MPVEKLHILMIDDDPEDIALVGAMLSRIPVWSVELSSCTDGRAAAAQVQSRKPDLVLLDFHFGEISGLEIYAAIRAAGYAAPIILLSGCDRENVASMIQAGITDHLSKNSLSSLTLYHAITLALEKHHLPGTALSAGVAPARSPLSPSKATSSSPPKIRYS